MPEQNNIFEKPPHLAFIYDEAIDDQISINFQSEFEKTDIRVETIKRPSLGPCMSMEWLLPTAIMVVIAKPYLDGFLKEAGKEHYHLLKSALLKLGTRLSKKNSPRIEAIHTKGKTLSGPPKYSRLFSIYGKVSNHFQLKLLIQTNASPDQLEIAIDAFILAMDAIHRNAISSNEIEGIDKAKPTGSTLLVTYDFSISKLTVIDPIPKKPDDSNRDE